MHTIIPENLKNILYIRTQEACLMLSPRVQEFLQSSQEAQQVIQYGWPVSDPSNQRLPGMIPYSKLNKLIVQTKEVTAQAPPASI